MENGSFFVSSSDDNHLRHSMALSRAFHSINPGYIIWSSMRTVISFDGISDSSLLEGIEWRNPQHADHLNLWVKTTEVPVFEAHNCPGVCFHRTMDEELSNLPDDVAALSQVLTAARAQAPAAEKHLDAAVKLVAAEAMASDATWLRDRPGGKIVARDRADAYTDGIRKGTHGAVQDAD